MKHKYSHIYVSVYGICEKCKHVIESKQALTIADMQYFIPNGENIRSLKLQKAYEEFDTHECTI